MEFRRCWSQTITDELVAMRRLRLLGAFWGGERLKFDDSWTDLQLERINVYFNEAAGG